MNCHLESWVLAGCQVVGEAVAEAAADGALSEAERADDHLLGELADQLTLPREALTELLTLLDLEPGVVLHAIGRAEQARRAPR